ncbi:uncharacterized protein LOC128659442 [Bombina bombina]|uniref:uncharacterized protein LOC128659442 n=1 Tax=Bombina bombina TaxID=8345 RepID=UPI00235AD360|nr:uncharacterized protein LOC128659442 [Bombina bombina]XP_053569044.1 uncharacterized protein LOC128659442 [Bombina bombina]XP_053569046.1 uncharacterized protein LOC128659442 [Bombina bombina]
MEPQEQQLEGPDKTYSSANSILSSLASTDDICTKDQSDNRQASNLLCSPCKEDYTSLQVTGQCKAWKRLSFDSPEVKECSKTKMKQKPVLWSYTDYPIFQMKFNELSPDEMTESSRQFLAELQKYNPRLDWLPDGMDHKKKTFVGPVSLEDQIYHNMEFSSNVTEKFCEWSLGGPEDNGKLADTFEESFCNVFHENLNFADKKLEFSSDLDESINRGDLRRSRIWEKSCKHGEDWSEIMKEDLKKFMEVMDEIKLHNQPDYDMWMSSLKLYQKWADDLNEPQINVLEGQNH